MTSTGERVFIRVLAPEPVWQVFPFPGGVPEKADIKRIGITELVRSKPEFLNFAEPDAVPFRAVVSLSKVFGVRSPILAAVDESGGVFLVGCPDESETGAYTTLVADLLTTGTRLWRMSYEQFSGIFTEVEGVSLEELMLLRSRADWEFEQFQPVIEANLENGKFPILIVTAHPEGEIRQVLDYLNGMNLTVAVVSYSMWISGGILVVEPARVAAPKSAASQMNVPPPVAYPQEQKVPVVEDEPAPAVTQPVEPPPARSLPAGALPTEPAKKVAKPPGPGTKPGVMAGKRPPPKPREGK